MSLNYLFNHWEVFCVYEPNCALTLKLQSIVWTELGALRFESTCFYMTVNWTTQQLNNRTTKQKQCMIVVYSICSRSLFNRSRSSFSIVETFSSLRMRHERKHSAYIHDNNERAKEQLVVARARSYVFAHEIVECDLWVRARVCEWDRVARGDPFSHCCNEIQLIIHMMFALWCRFALFLVAGPWDSASQC